MYYISVNQISSCLDKYFFGAKYTHLFYFYFFGLRSGFRVLTMGMHMSRDFCSSADGQLPAMVVHTLLCCVWMLLSWLCFSSGRGGFHAKTKIIL